MAQYNAPPKVKDKGPDEFISFFDHVVRFFMAHRIKFVALVALLVVSFGAYGVWLYFQSQKAQEVASIYEAALEAQGADAIADWQALIAQKPPLSLKAIASLELGGRLSQEKKWPEAAQAFSQATQASDKLLRSVGLWSTAVAWENAGDFAKSLENFDPLTANSKDVFYFEGVLGKARVLAQSGQTAKAEELLLSLLGSSQETQEDTATVPKAIQKRAQAQLLALRL